MLLDSRIQTRFNQLFCLLSKGVTYLIAILTLVFLLKVNNVNLLGNRHYTLGVIAGASIILVAVTFMNSRRKNSNFFDSLKLFTYSAIAAVLLIIIKVDEATVQLLLKILVWGIGIGVLVGSGVALGLEVRKLISRLEGGKFQSLMESSDRVKEFWNWYARRNED